MLKTFEIFHESTCHIQENKIICVEVQYEKFTMKEGEYIIWKVYSKRNVIHVSHDLYTLNVEELRVNLMAYEEEWFFN